MGSPFGDRSSNLPTLTLYDYTSPHRDSSTTTRRGWDRRVFCVSQNLGRESSYSPKRREELDLRGSTKELRSNSGRTTSPHGTPRTPGRRNETLEAEDALHEETVKPLKLVPRKRREEESPPPEPLRTRPPSMSLVFPIPSLPRPPNPR